ncbi:MAG: prephenate dehydrogenase/arogenate dehydrogenase family protein [Actinobacteria bacterium]|nr:prephenate dehydrogenase/arogenate dehydrogenase family protein [Actinomycetota bacterium]
MADTSTPVHRSASDEASGDVTGSHATASSVAIVGCGLIGASVAKALSQQGCTIFVSDTNPEHMDLLVKENVVTPWRGQRVDVVVVATPPSAVAEVVQAAHAMCPTAVITDVTSVKSAVASALAGKPGAARFVGSHPLAGGTGTGPESANADLFIGKPWAIVPNSESDGDAVQWVHRVVRWCGAIPLQMSAAEHDRVLALTSHAVQVVSSAVAGQLLKLDADQVALSGPALRDVTRIAASNAQLWQEILMLNSAEVAPHLRALAKELLDVATALESGDTAAMIEFMQRGNEGRRLLG